MFPAAIYLFNSTKFVCQILAAHRRALQTQMDDTKGKNQAHNGDKAESKACIIQ